MENKKNKTYSIINPIFYLLYNTDQYMMGIVNIRVIAMSMNKLNY